MKCHTAAHVKIARETRGDKRCATLWVLAGRPLDVRGLAVEFARKNHRIDSDIRAVRELKGQEKGNVPTQKTGQEKGNSWPVGVLVDVANDVGDSVRLPENLVQSIDHTGELLFRGARNPLADAIDRKRADLTYLDPRTLRQAGSVAL